MIDPKAAAGVLGSALATLIWILLATFVDAIERMDAGELTAVTGATAVILTGVLAYSIPNLASRLQGVVLARMEAAALPGGSTAVAGEQPNVELTDAMAEAQASSDPHAGADELAGDQPPAG